MQAAPARPDERLAAVGLWRRLLVKPELGSLIGAVVILAFFSVQSDVFRSLGGVANWLDVASTLGIMAGAGAVVVVGGGFHPSGRGVARATPPTPRHAAPPPGPGHLGGGAAGAPAGPGHRGPHRG